MSEIASVRYLAPGFGQTESLSEQLDTLLDFAQFYDYPDYQLMARTAVEIEKEFKGELCENLPEGLQEFLLDLQMNIIVYAHNSIHTDARYAEKALALAKKVRENPEQQSYMSRARATEAVHKTFEKLFAEEMADFFWYHRLIAKIIWSFDNWFGDKVATLYHHFVAEMVEEISYWKMARQISCARALG